MLSVIILVAKSIFASLHDNDSKFLIMLSDFILSLINSLIWYKFSLVKELNIIISSSLFINSGLKVLCNALSIVEFKFSLIFSTLDLVSKPIPAPKSWTSLAPTF